MEFTEPQLALLRVAATDHRIFEARHKLRHTDETLTATEVVALDTLITTLRSPDFAAQWVATHGLCMAPE